MTYKNGIDKFIEIFKRSNLSISKFASLIQKIEELLHHGLIIYQILNQVMM